MMVLRPHKMERLGSINRYQNTRSVKYGTELPFIAKCLFLSRLKERDVVATTIYMYITSDSATITGTIKLSHTGLEYACIYSEGSFPLFLSLATQSLACSPVYSSRLPSLDTTYTSKYAHMHKMSLRQNYHIRTSKK